MWRGLAHAIENALARAFGRSASQAISDWWGWAPLGWALLAAVLAYLLLRAFRVRRQRLYTAVAAVAVFAIASVAAPASVWVRDYTARGDAIEAVRDVLIDPQSAQITVSSIRRTATGRAVCGEVNAKARTGAFQGSQLFIVELGDAETPSVQIDSACHARPWRGALDRRPACETTIRSEFEDRMVWGWAHDHCETQR